MFKYLKGNLKLVLYLFINTFAGWFSHEIIKLALLGLFHDPFVIIQSSLEYRNDKLKSLDVQFILNNKIIFSI